MSTFDKSVSVQWGSDSVAVSVWSSRGDCSIVTLEVGNLAAKIAASPADLRKMAELFLEAAGTVEARRTAKAPTTESEFA